MTANVKNWLAAAAAVMLFCSASCAQAPRVYEHPREYNLNSPDIFYLWDVLHEISGIAVPDSASDRLYAVEDETGTLYRFQVHGKNLEEIRFGKKGDYEGIDVSKGQVIVLKSDGTLYSFPEPRDLQGELAEVREWKKLVPKEEYEGLAALADGSLFLLCKKCDADQKSGKTSGYRLQLNDSGEITPAGEFSIDHQQIENFRSLEGKDFRPSALTKNLATGKWYILSSVNQMLVIADEQFQVEAVYPLDPKLYNQPEGIAFDRSGKLYISSEGGDVTKKGTVLTIQQTP